MCRHQCCQCYVVDVVDVVVDVVDVVDVIVDVVDVVDVVVCVVDVLVGVVDVAAVVINIVKAVCVGRVFKLSCQLMPPRLSSMSSMVSMLLVMSFYC